MQISLAPGSEYRARLVVGKERTIDFMGEALRVYSTPSMILDVEDVCKDFLQQHLPNDSSSVGAHVEMDHLGPTLAGMPIEIAITVIAVDGRRVSFEAEVRDSFDVVGKAKHVRFIVNLAKQKERLESKAARFADQLRNPATHQEPPT